MSTPIAPIPEPSDSDPEYLRQIGNARAPSNGNGHNGAGRYAATPAPQSAETVYRITPNGVSSTNALGNLQEIWAHRRIASAMVQRILRLRYKGSAVGIFWSMVPPIVQVFTLTVVIGKIMGAGPKNYSAFMFCAFLPWIFFSNALLDSSSSVLEHLQIVKKTYFPREILPLAAVAANFIHFCIGLVVFLVYRYVVTTIVSGWPGWPPHELFIWFLPVVLDMVMLATGLAFALAAWTTFYEDVKYVVSTVLQLMFYLLPIIYFAENIATNAAGVMTPMRSLFYHLYLGNPFAWIVTAFKQMFFSIQLIGNKGGVEIYMAPFDWRYWAITTAVAVLALILGYREFQRLKWKFVERP